MSHLHAHLLRKSKGEIRLNAELTQQDPLIMDAITMRLPERNSPVNHQLNGMDKKFQEFLVLNAS